jgi:phosphopantothenoylcysteine synthetase/decarboxylase
VNGLKVLITSGGTREPIDGVRVITNSSTGGTGALIADVFAKRGAEVFLVRAEGAVKPVEPSIKQQTFCTSSDLDSICQQILSSRDIDLIIHAAAVSDFVVESVEIDGVSHAAPISTKLSSSAALSVHLRPGKKILPHLKNYSRNRSVRLVGFKLTNGATQADAQRAIQAVFASGADWVVHNDLRTIDTHRANVWSANGEVAECASLEHLARHLLLLGNDVPSAGGQ